MKTMQRLHAVAGLEQDRRGRPTSSFTRLAAAGLCLALTLGGSAIAGPAAQPPRDDEQNEDVDGAEGHGPPSDARHWQQRLTQLEQLLAVQARRMSHLEEVNAQLRQQLERSRAQLARMAGGLRDGFPERGAGAGQEPNRKLRPQPPGMLRQADAPVGPGRPRAPWPQPERSRDPAFIEQQMQRIERQLARMDEESENEAREARGQHERQVSDWERRREAEAQEREVRLALEELKMQREQLEHRANQQRGQLEVARLERHLDGLDPDSEEGRAVTAKLEELRLQLELHREQAALMEREHELRRQAEQLRFQAEQKGQIQRLKSQAQEQHEALQRRRIQQRNKLQATLEELRHHLPSSPPKE